MNRMGKGMLGTKRNHDVHFGELSLVSFMAAVLTGAR